MYTNWMNHLNQLLHLAFAAWFLYMFWPRFIFDPCSDDRMDNLIARYISMVFVVIVIGYVLVFLKIYEVITILLAIFCLVYLKYAKAGLQSSWKIKLASWQLLILDHLENNQLLKKTLTETKQSIFRYLRTCFKKDAFNWTNVIYSFLLFAVLIYSAYLRYYDLFRHAALPLADSYTSLAWAKHIEEKVLFYNNGGGIYPRGLSIYLATFRKFAFIDAFYILKYVGPLNSIMITFGIYYVLSRWTKNRVAGLIGAAMYGIFGYALMGSDDWERHAATNSQEFALLFVLPMTYFFYRYLLKRDRVDWRVGFAALAVAGFVHTLVFVFMIYIIGIMVMLYILKGFRDYFKQIWPLVLAVVVAVGLAAIPLFYGLLSGVHIEESALDFLTSISSKLAFPSLHWVDYAALTGLALCFLKILLQSKQWSEFNWEKIIFLTGAGTFICYYCSGPLTRSLVLAGRMGVLWSLMIAFLIGYAWYVCWYVFTSLTKSISYVQIPFFLLTLLTLIVYLRPSVITPYKMEWDSDVEQYLRINSQLRPLTWLIVSTEKSYAVILGQGFHLTTKDLLNYQPRLDFMNQWEKLPENIFVYYYKNIFKVNQRYNVYESELPFYKRVAREMPKLNQWIYKYRAAKIGPVKVYYEDRNLRVYYIANPYYLNSNRKGH